jgi:hypothetical protein
MLFFALILSFLSLSHADSSSNLCEVLNLENCSGVSKQARRSSARSMPSSATASQFNPANVSHDRGLGVETIYQPGQSASINFVAGTGKTGAALVNSRLENAFFGNRVPELEADFLARRDKDDQYKGEKTALAAGASLWRGRYFGIDLGLMGKYHPEIKRVNPGAGLSARIGNILTLGAAYYQDDYYLEFKDRSNLRTGVPYATEYGRPDFQERFYVTNFFGGLSLGSLFLDAGVIHTRYKFYQDDQTVQLYSAAFIWGKFLFNLALRHEYTPQWKYTKDGPVDERRQNETYGAIQYSFSKRVIVGVHHNYYLLRELAGSLTVFL